MSRGSAESAVGKGAEDVIDPLLCFQFRVLDDLLGDENTFIRVGTHGRLVVPKAWERVGGRSHDPLGFAMDNSEIRNSSTFGVLKVTLMPHAYTWEFIPVAGETFTDSGSGVCHNRAPQEANVHGLK